MPTLTTLVTFIATQVHHATRRHPIAGGIGLIGPVSLHRRRDFLIRRYVYFSGALAFSDPAVGFGISAGSSNPVIVTEDSGIRLSFPPALAAELAC